MAQWFQTYIAVLEDLSSTSSIHVGLLSRASKSGSRGSNLLALCRASSVIFKDAQTTKVKQIFKEMTHTLKDYVLVLRNMQHYMTMLTCAGEQREQTEVLKSCW